ncbi:oncoprotein-induced transcript 3 protein-like [Hypanus sabinus]|uniref:oncoprotein-induced transcript 3 protein-like n=1 Tax=Hypanus sabinus TaxID=79690 RepID=UPI0028C4007A|nr:oncoprotein-induced transcript 3 protein-like [Hypanus sabinus]
MRVPLLVLALLVTDSALGDPCVNHTVLDQPWRSTNCYNTECTGGQLMDDGNLEVVWYRLNSSGGWKIPETVVPQYHCSGENPGWLNGLHPNVGEGEVTRTVCFTVGENACFGSRDIRVKNCSGYFVYRLKPTPRSNAVYCTVTDSALGDPCVTHTVLDQPWRSTNCSNTECTGGQWMDDGNLAVGWYRFNSSGGWKIPETVVPQDHCSGYYPGWLTGPHPNVGEGEVIKTICFSWDTHTCYLSQGIKVKNCSGYFVYWLNPTHWGYAVYCTALALSKLQGSRHFLVFTPK